MPELRDTEWRLLCVIVRQTLGWRGDDGRRLERDWLTHSQLKRRTGRASAAVSAGLDGLVRRGLIEISDRTGKPISGKDERRRAYTRLYYRLHPQSARREAPFSENGNRKAKTTKESGTKVEIAQESLESEDSMGPELGEGLSCSNDDVAAFLRTFERRRLSRWPESERHEPPAHQDKRLESLLVRHGRTELEGRLAAFFDSDLGYVRRRGHSLASFLDTVFIIPLKRAPWPGTDAGPGAGR